MRIDMTNEKRLHKHCAICGKPFYHKLKKTACCSEKCSKELYGSIGKFGR